MFSFFMEDMMKEGFFLFCKIGSGLVYVYVKLEFKERCVYGGLEED